MRLIQIIRNDGVGLYGLATRKEQVEAPSLYPSLFTLQPMRVAFTSQFRRGKLLPGSLHYWPSRRPTVEIEPQMTPDTLTEDVP